MIYKLIKTNMITWIALTGLFMFLDFIQVKVVRFDSHGYTFVGSAILAPIAFFLTTFSQLSQTAKDDRYRYSFIASIAMGGAWLIFSMVFVFIIFHGLIGGSE